MAAKISSRSFDVTDSWRKRIPFDTHGALSAMAGAYWDSGRMPSEYATQYRAQRNDIVYTVLSYGTPIAWVLSDGTEVKPPVKYSVTTSKHQGKIY